jgi:phosphatidylethanolamine-binding protein (PEBP) family uncharacterized protein
MTVSEMKDQIMFQTNNDTEDIEDYEPYVLEYLNDGYDRLVMVWAKQHVSKTNATYPALSADIDVPATPEWTHRYIADWATWLVYRNGNPQKQQRGYAFRANFLEMLAKVAEEGGAAGLNEDGTQKTYRNFINIPV